MGAVLSMKKFMQKKENKVRSYSTIDMIIDPSKRNETYKYFNDNYKETEEEKEIFESWQHHYTNGDD